MTASVPPKQLALPRSLLSLSRARAHFVPSFFSFFFSVTHDHLLFVSHSARARADFTVGVRRAQCSRNLIYYRDRREGGKEGSLWKWSSRAGVRFM